MSLMDRIAARQCAVRDCHENRAQDAEVCPRDLTELFMHRLNRETDGTYSRRRALGARDLTWMGRAA